MAVNAGARNQWDRMPEPVRSRILACSSVLTRFTNGLLMPIELECLSYPEKNDLWYEAIKSEWSGDFHQLPHVFTLNNKTSESITSRSLFNRLPDWLFRFQGLREAIIVRNRWMDLVPGINVEVLADAAARTNAVWMLEDLIVKLKAVQPSSALAESAAASGHLEALKFLRAHTPSGVAWRDRVHYYAASSGNLDVLVWLSANRPEPIPATAFEIAATNGHMHIIEWLSKNFKGECSRPTLNEAARSGHLEMLKFLVKRFPNLAESYKREGYTELDSLPVIQWAHENKCKFDKREALEGLVFRGDIEGLEWMLKTFKMQANEKLLAKACELVQDRVANWLVNVKGVQITSNIVKEAVERSATSVLSVLIRKDRKWRDVAKRFAQSNNREILNWLAARHPA
nr:hypothetical protein HK105_003427 [Polyrhizophydium stewartii]